MSVAATVHAWENAKAASPAARLLLLAIADSTGEPGFPVRLKERALRDKTRLGAGELRAALAELVDLEDVVVFDIIDGPSWFMITLPGAWENYRKHNKWITDHMNRENSRVS